MATLRPLYQPSFMMAYLSVLHVLLKDFAGFASAWTERVRTAAHQLAERLNRPLTYLHGSSERKELLARDLARQDSLSSGLIGIWSVVEPCLTYFVRRDREQKKLVLRLESGKCLHYYFYFLHEQLGLLHLRLQTWFPFAIHACINGRHWLGRQMDQSGIDYLQRENCFTWIKDCPKPRRCAVLNWKAAGRFCCNRSLSNATPIGQRLLSRWGSPITGASPRVSMRPT